MKHECEGLKKAKKKTKEIEKRAEKDLGADGVKMFSPRFRVAPEDFKWKGMIIFDFMYYRKKRIGGSAFGFGFVFDYCPFCGEKLVGENK